MGIVHVSYRNDKTSDITLRYNQKSTYEEDKIDLSGGRMQVKTMPDELWVAMA